MDLLISILLSLGLHATPNDLNDRTFLSKNSAAISHAYQIIDQQHVAIKNQTRRKN